MDSSNLFASSRQSGRPLLPHQFRPDAGPGLLAERPAAQLALRRLFQGACLCGIHVSTPGKALVQVLLTQPVGFGECAPTFNGDFSAHEAHGSDSLEINQANRYDPALGSRTSGSLDNQQMETNSERRLRKLQLLISTKGLAEVAIASGLKPVYLEQIIKGVKLPPKKGDGSRSERALGDSAARAIEEAYDLGRGWFDNDGEEETMSPKELELLGLFRQLNDEVLQGLVVDNVREAVEQRAQLAERIRGTAREKKAVESTATKRRGSQ